MDLSYREMIISSLHMGALRGGHDTPVIRWAELQTKKNNNNKVASKSWYARNNASAAEEKVVLLLIRLAADQPPTPTPPTPTHKTLMGPGPDQAN